MGTLAHLLDNLFRIPGTQIRFGLDPLLGLLPGVGDATGAVLSAYLIGEAIRAGASRAVLMRMVVNLGVDAVLSAIPLLGDLLDAGWKANTRNLALLQQQLANPAQATAASRSFIVLVIVAVIAVIVVSVTLTVLTLRWLIGLIG